MWVLHYVLNLLCSKTRCSDTRCHSHSSFLKTGTGLCLATIVSEFDSREQTPFLNYKTDNCLVSPVFEGIFTSQFDGSDTPITATPGTRFYLYLNCTAATTECTGTAEEWIEVSFPDFSVDHIKVRAGTAVEKGRHFFLRCLCFAKVPHRRTHHSRSLFRQWDALYLVLVIFVSRVVTFIALTTLDYKAT